MPSRPTDSGRSLSRAASGLLAVWILAATPAFAQTDTAQAPDAQFAAELRAIDLRLDQLQRDLDRNREDQDRRVNAQIEAIDTRFDDNKDTTRWALGLLTLLAVVVSAVGSMSWWTGRKDSGRLLTEQVQNLGQISQVISLVRESFKLQLERETDVRAMKGMIEDLDRHYKDAYASVKRHILSLSSVTRMGWPSLSVFQVTAAASARAEFRSIPASMLTKASTEEPYEYAHVCQLLGTSAFYANDIGQAEQLLTLAHKTYEPLSRRSDYIESMAATSFFLGLIAKSWVEETRLLEDALSDAKRHLERAEMLLQNNAKEFQVPITLAEIESYIESKHPSAGARLKANIARLEAIQHRDDHEAKLLVRAYLLRGNLARGQDAGASYRAAHSLDARSPYAMLSLAWISPDRDEKGNWFTEGLQALKESKALDKHELTTRATALSWAVIATHELGQTTERDRYRRDLESIQAGAINTGGRVPLFFSPLSCKILRFDELCSEIDGYLVPRARLAAR
jgi:hypothetical protein